MKAVTFHRSRDDSTVGPVLPGHVDNVIRALLSNRPNRWEVRLRKYNDKGNVTFTGPWRHPREADEIFPHTVLDANVGAFFRVEGRVKRLFGMRVVEITDGARAVEYAKTEIGTPYRFGVANGPEDPGTDGFDCSGLTQWAWQQATNGAVLLPHLAAAQKFVGTAVSLANAQAGDLVCMWFPNSRGISWPTASHVGMFYKKSDNGPLMIDTRNPVNEPVGIRRIETGSVVGVRRPHR